MSAGGPDGRSSPEGLQTQDELERFIDSVQLIWATLPPTA
jgi:hypothetical protein